MKTTNYTFNKDHSMAYKGNIKTAMRKFIYQINKQGRVPLNIETRENSRFKYLFATSAHFGRKTAPKIKELKCQIDKSKIYL